jgi:hypothetical protein
VQNKGGQEDIVWYLVPVGDKALLVSGIFNIGNVGEEGNVFAKALV